MFFLSNRSNLQQRIITAIIGGLVVIFSVMWNQWAYFTVFIIITVATQLEFYKLLRLDDLIPLQSWGTASSIIIYTIFFLHESRLIDDRYYLIIPPFLYLAFLIKLYRKNDDKPFTNLGLSFLGIIYVAMPFSFLHTIAFYPNSYTPMLVAGIIFVQWASDTGAYFAGSYFGRRKLFERVSPKKSWEGFFGGMLVAVGISMLISKYFGILDTWQWVVIALIISVVGTYGDLIESLFKRSMVIKDSGTSLPGHGGFLDRFDSLLLSLPFIALFLKIS